MRTKRTPMTKDNPMRTARDRTIAEERLQGKSYAQLSEQFGLSKSRVGEILRDDEIKDVLETGKKRLVGLIPLAVENMESAMRGDDKTLKFKASDTLLKTVGISPSNSQHTIINQYCSQGPDNVLSPGVVDALFKMADRQDLDLIDTDPEEE